MDSDLQLFVNLTWPFIAGGFVIRFVCGFIGSGLGWLKLGFGG